MALRPAPDMGASYRDCLAPRQPRRLDGIRGSGAPDAAPENDPTGSRSTMTLLGKRPARCFIFSVEKWKEVPVSVARRAAARPSLGGLLWNVHVSGLRGRGRNRPALVLSQGSDRDRM